MSATQEKYLNKYPAVIEIVQDPGTLPVLADDLNNAEAVRTAINALTLFRLASVIDLQSSEDYSDKLKIETDDNGVIYTSTSPVVKISGTYYEIGNPDVLNEMLGKYVINGTGTQIVGSKIKATEMPKLICRITSTLPGSKVKQVYLMDANFVGQIINGFLDPNRAGDLPNSTFEFEGNKGGAIFTYTDDLPA